MDGDGSGAGHVEPTAEAPAATKLPTVPFEQLVPHGARADMGVPEGDVVGAVGLPGLLDKENVSDLVADGADAVRSV